MHLATSFRVGWQRCAYCICCFGAINCHDSTKQHIPRTVGLEGPLVFVHADPGRTMMSE